MILDELLAKASLRDKFCAKAQVLTSIVNCVLVPFEYLDSVLLSRISLYEEDLVKTFETVTWLKP